MSQTFSSRPRARIGLAAAVVAVLGSLLALSLRAAPDDAGEATTAVRKVLDDQVVAWNKGDLGGFMAGYWRDERLTFFSGPDRQAGWDATFERYRKSYQAEGKEMGSLTFRDIDIDVVAPGAAFARGRWELTMKDGKKPGGLFTLVFKKTKQGWRIVHDHTSK